MRLWPQLLQHHAFCGDGSGSRGGIRMCWDSLRQQDGTNARLHKAARGRTLAAAGSTKMMDIRASSWPFLGRRQSFVLAWRALDRVKFGCSVSGRKRARVSKRYTLPPRSYTNPLLRHSNGSWPRQSSWRTPLGAQISRPRQRRRSRNDIQTVSKEPVW